MAEDGGGGDGAKGDEGDIVMDDGQRMRKQLEMEKKHGEAMEAWRQGVLWRLLVALKDARKCALRKSAQLKLTSMVNLRMQKRLNSCKFMYIYIYITARQRRSH